MGARDPRVDAYVSRAADFAQPILRHIREVVHEAAPEAEETIKWSFPHFMHRGILCSMAAFKEHCAFGFWKESLILDTADATKKEAMGQFGRITALSDLPPRDVLIGYVREAVKLNEDGVKVPRPPAAQRRKDPPMHEDFRAALDASPEAAARFEAFSPSARREYLEWVAEAKRDGTRARRIATAVEWIAEGKPRNWKYMKGSRGHHREEPGDLQPPHTLQVPLRFGGVIGRGSPAAPPFHPSAAAARQGRNRLFAALGVVAQVEGCEVPDSQRVCRPRSGGGRRWLRSV